MSTRQRLIVGLAVLVVGVGQVQAARGAISTTQLTDNNYHDYQPQIAGSNVIWYGDGGDNAEIFLYDGTSVTQLTDNNTGESNAQVTDTSVVWRGDVGGDTEIFLATQTSDPSNASFNGMYDQNSLNIDFGTLLAGSDSSPITFDISNLVVTDPSADLTLESIEATGDTSVLTTDVTTFSGLAAGSSNSFTASMDTDILGDFEATYTLNFVDETGEYQPPLILDLHGNTQPVPAPTTVVSLIGLGIMLTATWIHRRRKQR